MNFLFLHKFRNLWPFSILKNSDLRSSDELVRVLPVPESTKRFVFAIRDHDSQSIIYILASQSLSERSASDADCLIKAVRPEAVVAHVGRSTLLELQSEGSELRGNVEHQFPTSPFGVIVKSFTEKFTKERYDNVARHLILREIFGVGFHGHVVAAKKAAEEIGSSFLLLEAPFVSNQSQSDDGDGYIGSNSSPERLSFSDRVQPEMIKSLALHLDVPKSNKGQSKDYSSKRLNAAETEETFLLPAFAHSIYCLFVDLHNVFVGTPLLARALSCVQKLLVDVNSGGAVEKTVISEVYTFRIAVEGIRMALNNAGRLPISKSEKVDQKIDFSQLSMEDKSYALLAGSLQSQGRKFRTIVAVVDANFLRGIRKHWTTPLPSEIKQLIELSVYAWDTEGELPNQLSLRWMFTGKPLVAVGAGATAVVGASSLSKIVPVSTLMKVVSLKLPTYLKLIFYQSHKIISVALSKSVGPSKLVAPGLAKSGVNSYVMKSISAQKIRTVAHSIIASAEKTSFSAMRTAFYEIMRKRRVKPVGALPWATFGGSVATCSALLCYGDGIEYAAESLPAAASIACLGRGIHSLRLASQEVAQTNATRFQQSVESFMYRLKNTN